MEAEYTNFFNDLPDCLGCSAALVLRCPHEICPALIKCRYPDGAPYLCRMSGLPDNYFNKNNDLQSGTGIAYLQRINLGEGISWKP
jgi:hypothetical protein